MVCVTGRTNKSQIGKLCAAEAAYRQQLAAGLRNFDIFDFALNGVEGRV